MAKLADRDFRTAASVGRPSGAHKLRKRIAVVGLTIGLVLIGAFAAAAPALSSLARSRIQRTLEDRFASDLQIQNLQVSLFPRFKISGEAVEFHRKGHSDDPPLIQMIRFTATGNILKLLARHVSLVRLEGLQIRVPPKDSGEAKPAKASGGGGKAPYFVIDEVIADGTKLSIIPRDSWKEPLVFDIKTLRMHDVGLSGPMSFDAVLTNAKPPGEIHSKGKFGPWDKDDPGDTPVSGDYSFRNANLGVFKGISGTLSSDGDYKGTLGNIAAEGHTDVPNFEVTLAGNPVHLTTDYQATIDGTSGNTYLHPVTAKFGRSTIVANGSVEGKRGGRGKTVLLDATVQGGRLEDLLLLGVHSATPALTGEISFHSKITIPPGEIDILQKLKLDGAFAAETAEFSKLNIQEKVNQLSRRAEGDPGDAAEAPTVASDFRGAFTLDGGVLALHNLGFRVPGAAIALNGTYGLLDETLHFRGTASLEAELSQTTTGFKSVLLKFLNPFFKKKGSGAGAVIPFSISGTRDKPTFGLDVLHRGNE